MFKKVKGVLVAIAPVSLVMVSSGAYAAAQAAVDVSDVVTGLGNQATPMTSIYVAGLGLAILGVAFKWIRKALGY